MFNGTVWVILTVLGLFLPSVAAASAPTSMSGVESCIEDLGLDDTDERRIQSGEIVSGNLPEGSDKELAVSVAMLVRAPLDEVVLFLRNGKIFELNRDVVSFRRLDETKINGGAFAGAVFGAEETDEISALLRVKPGSRFNLARSEISRLRSIAHRFGQRKAAQIPAVQEAVNAEYRQILLDRYLAYRQGGIEAIAPYERGGGRISQPRRAFSAQELQPALMTELPPDFYRAFIGYPRSGVDDMENQFLWIKHRVEDRPVHTLAHRMFLFREDYAVMAERQFYVGHTYNSLQIIMCSLKVPNGTLVFYQNRTLTDRVAGFASSIKQSIGREMMRNTIIEQFRDMRRWLQVRADGAGD